MVLKDILSISGESGLFRFIAQGKNSIIVEHLETKKRTAAHGTAKVSSLDDISIFTHDEDVPLREVFDKIYEKEKGGPAVSHKASGAELAAYFEEVLPDYDHERVYSSDIKKLISWYNTLQKLNLLIKEDPEAESGDKDIEAEEVKTEEVKADTAEKKPEKKSPAGKAKPGAPAKKQGK